MFDIAGTVVHGEKRGRELGYPTANLEGSSTAAGAAEWLPTDGVYAGVACVHGNADETTGCWVTAISVGTNPTFGENGRTVEAYLLDFDGDLYGRHLELHAQDLVRPMQAFDSVEALVDQMGKDVAQVRGQVDLLDHQRTHTH